MTKKPKTLEFRSEARQLLQLMVHSIYSNKDTFLRELIANASDALDKLRMETFLDKDLEADTSDPHIEIEIDSEHRTLTVRDNGIGMTHDEVIGVIGTIAKSGTSDFLQKLKESQSSAANGELIGQFGIGFYSSFMVADKVSLVTRRAGTEQGVRWESNGEDTYTIEDVADAPQGTAVTLYLKPEDLEDHLYDYTSPWKIREVVKRYSDFITWPVKMMVERQVEGGSGLDDDDEDDDGTPKVISELQTLNSTKALWSRPKSEVDDAEYREFYSHISHDWNEPLEVIRMQAEGTFEYQALLFIPSRAPYGLFTRESKRGVQLYVKRVFIMDDCEELMPPYLRFIKGVVDAQDLSLNVSRETLQRDRHIQVMRRRLVRKVLSTVKEMISENPAKYEVFWREFGRAVKEGLLDDFANQSAILEISSFSSTHDPEKPTTLPEYIDRMKEGQQHIYYVTGDSRQILEKSPHLEAFRAKGIEVLLLTDPIDEMWVDSVHEFDSKQFQSIAKGRVDLDAEEDNEEHEAEREQRKKDFAPLLSWMSDTLRDQVKEVRLSSRLTSSPACVVGDDHDVTPNLEKMYRSMGQDIPPTKRILELNPEHPVVSGLHSAYSGGEDPAGLTDAAELIHGMALLSEGGELSDPSRFIGLLAGRLERTL